MANKTKMRCPYCKHPELEGEFDYYIEHQWREGLFHIKAICECKICEKKFIGEFSLMGFKKMP